MAEKPVMLITGTRKGIGRYLAQYYAQLGFSVIGCSRKPFLGALENYEHFILDISNEEDVKKMFLSIRKKYGRLDVLINNAGIASMNHLLLTPVKTVSDILHTNVLGTFIFCREAAKLMVTHKKGRIVNFTTVAVPLQLEGEAMYAASKSAIMTMTQIFSKELAEFGITVNAVGPCPVQTDLIAAVPEEKIKALLARQAIHRWGDFADISNVINFFIQPESDFITGQVIYLGGV